MKQVDDEVRNLSADLDDAWRAGIVAGERLMRVNGIKGGMPPTAIHSRLRPSSEPPLHELDVDASFRGGYAGLAAILWSPGYVVQIWTDLRRISGSNAAESMTFLWALNLAAHFMPIGTHLRVWTDSTDLTNGLGKKSFRRQVHRAARGLGGLTVEWVPRFCLVEVDGLAFATRRGRHHPVRAAPSISIEHRLRVRGNRLRAAEEPYP